MDDCLIAAVTVLIFRHGRVLAMQRARGQPAAPGLWEAVSGRIEPGEAPLDAARREVVEETALQVNVDPRPVTAYTATRLTRPMIVVVYRAHWLAGRVKRSHEHDDHAWCTPAAFCRRCPLPKLQDAVREAAALDVQSLR
jgi:8-oxo-dGTP pyrophosphatase MutT (NUDIX family)